MLRMIFAGIAAATIGTIGGLTLVAATPAKGPTPQVKLTNAAPEIAPSSPKTADPVLIEAPKRMAEVAPSPPPAPTPKAQPESKAEPAAAKSDKPEIRFDGDRVSVRFGKFKIDF